MYWGGEERRRKKSWEQGRGGRREVVYQTNRGPETWMEFTSELIVV